MAEVPLLTRAPRQRVRARHIIIVLLIAVSQTVGIQIASFVLKVHSAEFLVMLRHQKCTEFVRPTE